MNSVSRHAQTILLLLLPTLAASGCAGTHTDESERRSYDPWESANRSVFAFNRGLDNVSLKLAAKGYRKITPGFVRTGISNFYSNLRTPLTIINLTLQGKGRSALSSTGRMLLNSTVGLGGLLDPATASGLQHHDEDFGQTLAKWGVPDGPFVVVPLLGPRNLRDALTVPFDLLGHPLVHYEDSSVRDKLWALEAIEVRARLLSVDRLLEDSFDPYITVREAWRQNREYEVYDGDPPVSEDFYDEHLDEHGDSQP